MESLLHELLDARDYLLADGATGTNYFELGLGAGDSPELWNADHADRVKALHRAFIEAGSDIVLSNTFGGNRYRLKLHDAENRVFELNELAAKNARAEADRAGKPVVVAGSMGPTGEIFAPVGSLDMVDGEAAFREQAEGLAAGGADLLWIETMSSREEVEAATRGARSRWRSGPASRGRRSIASCPNSCERLRERRSTRCWRRRRRLMISRSLTACVETIRRSRRRRRKCSRTR